MTANGSGTRRAAGVATGGAGAAAARTGAADEAAAGLAAERGFALRLDPALAGVRDAAGSPAFDDDAPLVLGFAPVEADAREREPAPFAAGALDPEPAEAAEDRLRERAGVSVEAAASGAADAGAALPDAGRARLALRRAGRVRGRLLRTSRSSFFGEPSLGGMARLLPIRSHGA